MAHEAPGKDFSSYDYYRALFNNPKKNSVLILDEAGLILQVNRAFLLSFGYDERDLLGQHFAMLFTAEDRERDLPMREVQTVMDEGQSFDNNYLVNKNGVRTWASGESVLLVHGDGRQCILKIIQNIHVQKESEQSILRLNTFNESILASIEDAVVVLNSELKLIKANRSFLELFSLEKEHLGLVDFQGLIQTADRKDQLYAAVVDALKKGPEAHGTLEVELEEKCFEVSWVLLDHGTQDNLLLIFHDVTMRKSQDRQREDILNFVAHELRNPLTNIMLNIDWMDELRKEKNIGEIGDFIERTKRNAERLKKLINELYRSTKLISGNYDIQREAFDLDGFIDEGISAIAQAHPEFKIVRRGDARVQLAADKDKLLQVLTNYLSNAVKYSGENKDIEVRAAVRDASVVVAVTDRGKGIPAREIPFLFNRFYRAERTRSLEGLGVGLFLSRQIVEAHRGRTWVESVEGKGSTFYFSVPMGE